MEAFVFDEKTAEAFSQEDTRGASVDGNTGRTFANEYTWNSAVDGRDPTAFVRELIGEDDYHYLLKRVALEGYSLKETADGLGITLAAFKKRFQRAKKILREKIEDN